MKKQIRIALVMLLLPVTQVLAEHLEFQAVEYQSYPQQIDFDGVVEAVNQATISAQTAGRVEEINFDVDDFVPKGSVIMRLRDKEQRSQYNAAQAALSEADAMLVKARAEHQRISELYDKKLVAKSALDQAVADLRSSEERRKAAVAKQRQAKEQLDYTIITAPYGGIVVARHIEVGEMAKVGQPLMTGFAIDDMRVTASVPQDYIELVRQNKTAQVVLEKPSYQLVESDEMTFYPYADPITHTFKVRVGIPGGLKGIYPGMMVKVAFTTGKQQLLAVDPHAVVHRSEVSAVYVVDGHKVSYRLVRLGKHLHDGRIEVLAGLHEGEQVALDPVQAGILLKRNGVGHK